MFFSRRVVVWRLGISQYCNFQSSLDWRYVWLALCVSSGGAYFAFFVIHDCVCHYVARAESLVHDSKAFACFCQLLWIRNSNPSPIMPLGHFNEQFNSDFMIFPSFFYVSNAEKRHVERPSEWEGDEWATHDDDLNWIRFDLALRQWVVSQKRWNILF
jgi:hypothetical protein